MKKKLFFFFLSISLSLFLSLSLFCSLVASLCSSSSVLFFDPHFSLSLSITLSPYLLRDDSDRGAPSALLHQHAAEVALVVDVAVGGALLSSSSFADDALPRSPARRRR